MSTPIHITEEVEHEVLLRTIGRLMHSLSEERRAHFLTREQMLRHSKGERDLQQQLDAMIKAVGAGDAETGKGVGE